ncbi:hypothetical protein [Psychrobacter piscatorii]|uniref:hypothetical protein n=1 Tax=Psychrobacter piscatorii TaxID=554343 RepID=UPI001917EB75|nr:hypothetical protein [Psychrobacter piscatorii]
MDEYRKLRMRIFRLFKQGQLKEAVELFESNNMDYFETAPTDKWVTLPNLRHLINRIKRDHPRFCVTAI